MRHATEDVARLVVAHFNPLFECFDKGYVAGAVALNDFARGFINYYEVIVFVNDFHNIDCDSKRWRKVTTFY